MGLFGKLFEKKECSVCGGEIGLLGNRKLEDGNLCKQCAKKLSPWFEDRRHATVAEIEQQLAYREQNLQKLETFRPSCRIGESYRLIAEERNGVPYRFVVEDDDYLKENADLILFTDVSSCNIKVDESTRELKQKNDKGESVSYDPPRYEYSYNFFVTLTIENNPYFDEIRFKLNSFNVDINPDSLGMMPGQSIGQLLFGRTEFDPNQHPEYSKFMRMCREIEALVDAGRHGAAAAPADAEAPAPAEEPAAPSPAPRFCSHCGSPVSGGKFCTNCGAKL